MNRKLLVFVLLLLVAATLISCGGDKAPAVDVGATVSAVQKSADAALADAKSAAQAAQKEAAAAKEEAAAAVAQAKKEADAAVAAAKKEAEEAIAAAEKAAEEAKAAQPEEPEALLTDEEMEQGKQIFFNHCAGCHGVLRKGATGKNITPEGLAERGRDQDFIKTIITNGFGGMPAWGNLGILNADEVDLMSRFVLSPVPEPPAWLFEDIKNSWTLKVPVDERPTKPQGSGDWENYFGVILRDVGKVAIVDGDTKEMLNVVNTGFATHILRSSKDGRYFYVIGRDGKLSLIDLWMEKPDVVAETRTCLDARSVDSSKFEGFEGKYAVVGCYWPSAMVVVDGQTLEPIKMVSTQGYDRSQGDFIRENRVAAIVSSHLSPEWIVNVKEAGQIWVVDYSNLEKEGRPLGIKMLDTERYLHDGGWDSTKRYFLEAANTSKTVVVLDTKEGEYVATIPVGDKPHPGRGANWNHPEYGPVWATGHIKDNKIAIIGTDPEGHPDQAWKVVKMLETPSMGNLFIKTHENSPWLIADFTVAPVPEMNRTLCAWDKNDLEKEPKCWEVEGAEELGARVVHQEFNKAGTEFWVSLWGKIDTPTAIVVYDATTLEEIDRIVGDWVITPTGKFNVYNTANDLY
jgi:nitrite reductase (NO-forming)/hydroxylamine reductase